MIVLQEKKIDFKGWGDIISFLDTYNQEYFISNPGSIIMFGYKPDNDDLTLPPIYPNYYNKIPLKNCTHVLLNDIYESEYEEYGYLVSCDITEDELDSFYD